MSVYVSNQEFESKAEDEIISIFKPLSVVCESYLLSVVKLPLMYMELYSTVDN